MSFEIRKQPLKIPREISKILKKLNELIDSYNKMAKQHQKKSKETKKIDYLINKVNSICLKFGCRHWKQQREIGCWEWRVNELKQKKRT